MKALAFKANFPYSYTNKRQAVQVSGSCVNESGI